MTDIISRLLDEAEKAQRKGHLVLAEVCRDASDKIGLLANELADMTSDYLRRHKDACDRMVEIERLRAALSRIANGDFCAQHMSSPPICVRAYEARLVVGERRDD